MDEAIPANEFSRVIDLGREGKYLDHIEFKYRSTGNILKGRALCNFACKKILQGLLRTIVA